MKVKYLDLKTGKRAEEKGISEFQLTEGNWSCDCNRALAFNEDDEEEICKSQRYLVYDVENEDLEKANIEDVIKRANEIYYYKLLKD